MLAKAFRSIGSPRQWVQDDLLRRLFKNAAVLFSGNMIASLLGLASLALTARALGVEQFGFLVLITTYVLIVDRLVNFQSWQAIIKYGADALEKERREDFKSLIKFGFLLDGATAVLGAVVAACAAWFVGQWRGWDDQLVLMAALYSFTILFHINGTPTAILRLFNKFKLVAYQNVIASVIKLVGVTIAFFSGAGLWAFLLVWAVVDVVGKLVLVFFAGQELTAKGYRGLWGSSTKAISQKFKGIWAFVWTTNINSSIRMTSRELDVMIIAGFLGPAAVGLYKIAKQFASVIQKTIDPLYQAIYPELAKLFTRGEIKNFIFFGLRSSLIAGMFAALVWLGFYFFSEYIFLFTVGAEYLDAVGVLLWYMMAIVVATIAFPLQPAMLAMGLPHTTFWVHIGSTIVYFSVLYVALPSLGLIGAGVAYLVYYLSWSCAMLAIEAYLLARRV
ncbi:Membrane protein involved in the export of O-antigen and teichoic acid [Geoalkalibacter ferrihydriticus]|uniref:Polysaccharide biosynthesis protein C-terminal domain-containing protein n=2 Tax=Geoalkalibacter ferrihydriticus TaxID=392333 RepID=A0A0C2HRK6_9BACT|nr:oligosaccharide flippase family protein [Geoalkalibacter ferrihydriticus]KIH75412.1 hypothetical protein GFER_16625 [Geoalkalibacter ferrihydriticus DSM 17813]SDM91897.1 Membrane protein involved in the export of O-antigen and teichoic acid [Geoalkalibacter ferrihydriticus]